ncbi:hypothetical protein FGG08_000971 [Glutinoglossum americanum]|uniref:Alpha/beta hydrolase fold-3 domain-containing protein n=1 Tax=Glutinoglossum americanum TaxID=1670608 RepID=A0A9P8I2U1_9PEZI|nr:hypothetical protein FGG08_000971 [Glutinoglossum americanum]
MGGGFLMGSSYFYMEFLFAWVSSLKQAGFRNPALFALEYTLVPDAIYPTQLVQTVAGYEHVLSITQDPSRVCVGGDSAGGTLILSLLLYLANSPGYEIQRPGLAILVSPWVTLVSPKNHNTRSDYLNAESLHLYARQYAGSSASLNDPLVSPGMCKDLSWWSRAVPSAGIVFYYGSEEVFCQEIRDLAALLEQTGRVIQAREEEGLIHAWPVATLFLSDSKAERQKGIKEIVQVTWGCMNRNFGSKERSLDAVLRFNVQSGISVAGALLLAKSLRELAVAIEALDRNAQINGKKQLENQLASAQWGIPKTFPTTTIFNVNVRPELFLFTLSMRIHMALSEIP